MGSFMEILIIGLEIHHKIFEFIRKNAYALKIILGNCPFTEIDRCFYNKVICSHYSFTIHVMDKLLLIPNDLFIFIQ